MTHALDQSILELLNASRDDEQTLNLPVNDRTFGFHAQQAVEKLLKALIGGHEKRYSLTHDIRSLIEQLLILGEQVPGDAILLESLTDYAVLWRYQEPEPMAVESRIEIRNAISLLRAFTFERLLVLRPTVDWPTITESREPLD